MELWVVGQTKPKVLKFFRKQWEFQGVFDTKEKAIKACRNWMYFYAPAILNEELQDKCEQWPECIYPNQNITWKQYWKYYPFTALFVRVKRFLKIQEAV